MDYLKKKKPTGDTERLSWDLLLNRYDDLIIQIIVIQEILYFSHRMGDPLCLMSALFNMFVQIKGLLYWLWRHGTHFRIMTSNIMKILLAPIMIWNIQPSHKCECAKLWSDHFFILKVKATHVCVCFYETWIMSYQFETGPCCHVVKDCWQVVNYWWNENKGLLLHCHKMVMYIYLPK